MPTVAIYESGDFIGHADLEHFDDGMGVAHGPFRPAELYWQRRGPITASNGCRYDPQVDGVVMLKARASDGEILDTGFIAIEDFDDRDAESECTIQLSSHQQQRRLFPAAP